MNSVPAMTATFPEVHLLSVAIAAIAMMVVNLLWYSPFLFGKAWTRHTSIRPGDIRPKDARLGTIYTIIASLISAYLLGLLTAHTGHTRTMLCAVALVWLFIALEKLSNVIWRRDPMALFLLQAFRSLATLTAGSLVFYFWS